MNVTVGRGCAFILWLVLSTLTYQRSTYAVDCQSQSCQSVRVNFRPLVFPVTKTWNAEVLAGEANVEVLQENNFGLSYKIESPTLSAVKIRFSELNSFKKSYIYSLSGVNLDGDIWLYQQSGNVFYEEPSDLNKSEDKSSIKIYYTGLNNSNWQAHLWDPFGVEWTSWESGLTLKQSTFGNFNQFVEIPLPPFDGYLPNLPQYTGYPEPLGLIVHRGAEKAIKSDIQLFPKSQGNLFFLKKGDAQLYCSPDFAPCPSPFKNIRTAAHWLAKDFIVWDTLGNDQYRYELLFDPTGNIQNTADIGNISEKQRLRVWPAGVPEEHLHKFPHLRGLQGFRIEYAQDISPEMLLTSQLLLVAIDKSSNSIVDKSRLQIPGILDQLMSYDGKLGLNIGDQGSNIKLWAPTAQKVSLNVYKKDKTTRHSSIAMERQDKGVWQTTVEPTWIEDELFYRFEIQVFHYVSGKIETYEVTDPYAVSLSMNSSFSQFVDLSSPNLKPEGWDNMNKEFLKPQDISIMEIHVRDFSIGDQSVKNSLRGTYGAFTSKAKKDEKIETDGRNYLASLQESGLSHVQFLPVNDFGTVNEDRKEQLGLNSSINQLCEKEDLPYNLCQRFKDQKIEDIYRSLPADTAEIAAINEKLAKYDGFNWGYDPVHFGVPDGTYARNPDGSSRILEFRQMIKALWDMGLRVSIDVVYNHTMDALLWNFSILDKTVPGYYFRRNPTTGFIESSTCCNNTASEHKMMEHLMIATLQRWQNEYKIDAFRFDLMGHHMKDNMLAVKQALNPGVYLYGEGWNFGEVKDNRRGVNATQKNMAGTGIATFNDRFRDAVRGGAPFDCGVLLHQQGLLQGLYFDNNELGSRLNPTSSESNCQNRFDFVLASPEEHRNAHQEAEDRLRIGLAGSIKRFNLFTHYGESKEAQSIGPWGYPIGYVDQPFESINYISKHDNQTLWDFNQLKLPLYLDLRERAKTQWLAMSLNVLAQGVPFFHFGVDLLRSKSQIRDSYNAGDWFNRVDLSRQTTQWNTGLPTSNPKDMNWQALQNISRSVVEGPYPELISESHDYFRALLKIRYSSELFRLPSADDIRNKISFLNSGPRGDERIGLIMMKINDASCSYGKDIDPKINDYVVIFNTRPWPVKIDALGYQVHSALSNYSKFYGSSLEIGGRSTTVIFRSQQDNNCYTDQPVYVTGT